MKGQGWQVLIACALGMVAMAVSIHALSPVSHKIQEILDLDFGRLGILMGIIALPGVFLSIPGGRFADRWGGSRLLYAALLCLTAGALIFVMSRSYALLCLSRLITGVGCAFLSVVLPGFIAPAFGTKERPMAMGIFNMALPLGSIVTLTFLGILGAAAGWFEVFLVPCAAALLALAAAFFLLPRSDVKHTEMGFHRGDGPVWILGAVFFFCNMAVNGYVTMGAPYFCSQKVPMSLIGVMLSPVLWGTLLLSPMAGALSREEKGARALLFWGNAAMAAAFLLIPLPGTSLVLDLVLLALSSGVVTTPVYVMVTRMMPPARVNTGYGIIMTCLMAGCLAGPYAIGLCIDRWGFFGGFAMASAASVLAAFSVLFIPPVRQEGIVH